MMQIVSYANAFKMIRSSERIFRYKFIALLFRLYSDK